MKKILVLSSLGLVCVAGISTDLLAESKKGAYIGLDVGGCRILDTVDGYRIGGEIGVHVSKRIGIIADFGYAYQTKYQVDRLVRIDYTYSSVPISGTLAFITPVTQNFLTQIGIGLGYYSFKIRYEQPIYGRNLGSVLTWINMAEKYNGIAPHIRISIEAEVSNRIAIYAGIKHIVGKAETEIFSYYEGEYSKEIHFGGPEIKAGVKFYLW